MKLSAAKADAILHTTCNCAFAVFHARCDLSKQYISIRKIGESFFYISICSLLGRIKFAFLSNSLHGYKRD